MPGSSQESPTFFIEPQVRRLRKINAPLGRRSNPSGGVAAPQPTKSMPSSPRLARRAPRRPIGSFILRSPLSSTLAVFPAAKGPNGAIPRCSANSVLTLPPVGLRRILLTPCLAPFGLFLVTKKPLKSSLSVTFRVQILSRPATSEPDNLEPRRRCRVGTVVLVPVMAPLPDVAGHVVEAPRIVLFPLDRARRASGARRPQRRRATCARSEPGALGAGGSGHNRPHGPPPFG